MKSDVLLVTGAGWRLFQGRDSRPVEPFPRLTRPTRAIVGFEDAYTGLLRFEGRRQYARPIIERQVRQEGWIDGPSHVVLHHLTAARGGGQAFYTAVALGTWQRMLEWAKRQPDHCLLIPAGHLLASVGEGRGRVLRLGRRLQAFARVREGVVAADSYSASEDPEDRRLAAQTLGANLAEGLAEAGGRSVRLEWVAAEAESEDDENALARIAANAAGIPVRLAPLKAYRDESGKRLSALPKVTNRLGAGASVNSLPERAGWWSEAASLPVAVVIGALAVGLAGAGEYARMLAGDERNEARALMAEVREKRHALQSARVPDRAAELQRLADFMSELSGGAPYTPARVLRALRDAATESLRIHRVFVEAGRRGDYRLRVDGRDRSAESAATRRFLTALRAAGWSTQALEPADGRPGSFSYRLRPVERDT